MESFKIELLKRIAEWDMTGMLEWTEDLSFWVQCSDFSSYASADGEDISSQKDLDLLIQSYEDIKHINFGLEFGLLYACRKRRCSPMPDALSQYCNDLQNLFIEAETYDKN